MAVNGGSSEMTPEIIDSMMTPMIDVETALPPSVKLDILDSCTDLDPSPKHFGSIVQAIQTQSIQNGRRFLKVYFGKLLLRCFLCKLIVEYHNNE